MSCGSKRWNVAEVRVGDSETKKSSLNIESTRGNRLHEHSEKTATMPAPGAATARVSTRASACSSEW